MPSCVRSAAHASVQGSAPKAGFERQGVQIDTNFGRGLGKVERKGGREHNTVAPKS